MKKIWYGYSAKDNQCHFFDDDPGRNSEIGKLEGTGSFTLDERTVQNLNIERVPQQTAANPTA